MCSYNWVNQKVRNEMLQEFSTSREKVSNDYFLFGYLIDNYTKRNIVYFTSKDYSECGICIDSQQYFFS